MVNGFLSKIRPWRELALWMLVMLETSWLVPWYFLLVPEAATVSPWVVFCVFWLIVMVANTAMRTLYMLRLRALWRQCAMILLLLAAEVASLKALFFANYSISFAELINRPLQSFADWREFLPTDFIILGLVLIAFWRGIELSQGPIDSALVRDEFRFGIVMCLVFIFLDFNFTQINVRVFVYMFIFSGLVAMSSARIAVLENLRGGRRYGLNWMWATGIVALAVGMVGISVIAAFILILEFPVLARLLTLPIILVAALLMLLSLPVLYLLIWILSQTSNPTGILDLIYEILNRLNSLAKEFFEKLREFLDKIQVNPLIARLTPYIKPILLWSLLLFGLFLLALWVAFERLQEKERKLSLEEREALDSDHWPGWRNAVKKGLGKIVSLLRESNLLRHRHRRQAAARIRQIYADLLDLCDQMGTPRPEGSTPLEFVPVLKGAFPTLDQEIELITARYLMVRYGQFSEAFWDLEPVERAWRMLFANAKEHLESARSSKKKG